MKECIALLLIISFVLSSTAFADLQVQNPWVRATTEKNTAAYMELTNTSDQEVKLVSASSAVARRCELHTITDNGSGLEMRETTAISIPAKGNIFLEPGKTHLMLMDLNQPLSEEDVIPFTLHFSDGTRLNTNAPVKAK